MQDKDTPARRRRTSPRFALALTAAAAMLTTGLLSWPKAAEII